MQNFSVTLSLLFILSAGTRSATASYPGQNDEQRVKAVVYNFWASSQKLNWKGMESRVAFPFTAMSVGPKYAGATAIYKNRGQFEAKFGNIKKLISKGLSAEVKEDQAGAHILGLRAELKNNTSAYVTYTYQPNGDKNPYQLMTLLRKGKTGWKIVFSTVPW